MAIYSTSKNTSGEGRTDQLVDFKTKAKAPWIIENAQRIIEYLYKPNDPELETCLGYFNGVRPQRKFRALADNYGIGTPHKIPFISLMQRHVKALTGYYMQLPFPCAVSAVDRDSISLARDEQARQAVTGLMQLLNQTAQSAFAPAGPAGQPGGQPQGPPPVNQLALQEIKRQNETFVSQLERFTSILFDSLIIRLKLRLKSASLVESRAVSGRFYHRAWLEEAHELPRYETIPAEEIHHLRDKSLGSLREHRQVLRHRRMLRADAMARWGHLMSDEEKRLVGGKDAAGLEGLDWIPLRQGQEIGAPRGKDGQGNPQGFVDGPYLDQIAIRRYGLRDKAEANMSLIDVYEGEFISTSPEDEEELDDDEQAINGLPSPFRLEETGTAMALDKSMKPKSGRHRQHVYRFVRLGSNVYLECGRYKYAQRPVHDASQAYLTYHGEYGERSMILDTVDLQDKSDLLNFHQDNLIALGGVPGVMLDINDIPKWFHPTDQGKRIAKFLAQIKAGLVLLDRSQSGKRKPNEADASAFNNSGKVDTSFNAQAVTAIKEQLAYISEQAQQISGVPRQMQGDIQERDGLGTTNQAIASASAVNRPAYAQVFNSLQDICTDLLNLSRVTAHHNPELIASLIGTAGMHVIAAGAERFPLAYYNVNVGDAMEEEKALQRVQAGIDQLTAAQAVDPKLIIDAAGINNVAQLRDLAYRAIEDHQQNAVQQLEQQVQQLQQQVGQQDQQKQALDQGMLQIAQQKMQNEVSLGQQNLQLEGAKLQQEASDAAADRELDQKRVDLEGEQLFFSRQSQEVANE